MVCLEYLLGVENLRVGTLSRSREIQECHLEVFACCRLFKESKLQYWALCKWVGIQSTSIHHLRPIRWEGIQGRCSESGIFLPKPDLVQWRNVICNSATDVLPFLRVPAVECIDQGSNTKGLERYKPWRLTLKWCWLLDKGYQGELPMDVWMFVFYQPSKRATLAWALCKWPGFVPKFPWGQPYLWPQDTEHSCQCNLPLRVRADTWDVNKV